MPSSGKLPIITPILFLIAIALYITMISAPAFPLMQIEINSTFVTWHEGSHEYKYLTIYGVQKITMSKFWEITIIILNKGKLPTKIMDVTINNEQVGKVVKCLSMKSDNCSVYNTFKASINPGEKVKLVVLVPLVSGKFTHGKLIEIKIHLQGKEISTMIMLP
ncbi:MAG: hypothetical protein NDF55_05300 [archaeon GB-1867-005]|nr:hypothetical protein [Candidatus Culexmicrobium cathedralense]